MAVSDFRRATARYQTCNLHGNPRLSVVQTANPGLGSLARAFRISYLTTTTSVTVPVAADVIEIVDGRTRLTVEENSISLSAASVKVTVVKVARTMLSRARR
jgi:hypothetical protein